MGVGFIGACVLLGPLFGLSPLSGRAWTLLGVFAAATPALMCLFVFLVSRVKQRLRRSQRAKHAAGLSASAFNISSIVYAALVCYDGTGPKRNERNLPKWKCQPEKPSKHCADKRD